MQCFLHYFWANNRAWRNETVELRHSSRGRLSAADTFQIFILSEPSADCVCVRVLTSSDSPPSALRWLIILQTESAIKVILDSGRQRRNGEGRGEFKTCQWRSDRDVLPQCAHFHMCAQSPCPKTITYWSQSFLAIIRIDFSASLWDDWLSFVFSVWRCPA